MEGLIVPSITGVCDLQSGLTDGTITPCAQLLVSGKHLDMVGLGSIRLCLVSATECQHVIEIAEVYRHTVTQVIVSNTCTGSRGIFSCGGGTPGGKRVSCVYASCLMGGEDMRDVITF